MVNRCAAVLLIESQKHYGYGERRPPMRRGYLLESWVGAGWNFRALSLWMIFALVGGSAVIAAAGEGRVASALKAAGPASTEAAETAPAVIKARGALLNKAAPLSCVFEDTLNDADQWVFSAIDANDLWHFQEESACEAAAPGYASAAGCAGLQQ